MQWKEARIALYKLSTDDLSEEQLKALDISKNIALKAGAGSGKTRVLTKRYIKLLNDIPGIKIDNIVAITFTRKAASEMKDRIRKEIEVMCKVDSEKEKWTEFRNSLSFANIDTIHGFCERIIRDNFADAGVDPLFTIIDEAESNTAVHNIVRWIVDEALNDPVNKDLLKIMFKKYPSKIVVNGKFEAELISLMNRIKETGLRIDDVKLYEGEEYDESTKAMELLTVRIIKKIDEEYDRFKKERNLLDFNDLEIAALKLLSDDSKRDSYFERYKYILVDEFQDINQIQKRIILKLAEKNGVIPDGRLFIVGDYKQSIYGFRGTDYRIFEEFCEKIKKEGDVLNLSNCYRSTKNIICTVNSVFKNLLEPYEELKYLNDTEEGPKVELITYNKQNIADPRNERFQSIKKLLKDDSKSEELHESLMKDIKKSESKRDFQGSIIASRILKLLDEGYKYEDIAILLRSRTGLESVENALLKYGIPYCVIGGIGFWDKSEIIDIISLYKLVFDMSDKIALLVVLRSPIFGFSDDDVYNLMSIYNDEGLSNILEALEKLTCINRSNEWIIVRAYNILKEISNLNGIYGAYEIFEKILDLVDYKKLLISLPNGYQKYRNIEKLEKIIKDFTDKDIFNARDLVEYLSSFKEFSGLDSEAFLDTEESDAVKILTIHASKGLEFEAVIIPDMDKATDGVSIRRNHLFMLSEDGYIYGIGVNEEGELDKEANSRYKSAYDEYLERENQESRRLFYVASTRAKRFLAFIGQEKNKTNELQNETGLNSFMKQLLYAMDIDDIDIAVINGNDLLMYDRNIKICKSNDKSEIGKLKNDNLIAGIPLKPQGNISITAYIDYLSCPKLYYYKYIAALNDEYIEEQLENDDFYEYDALDIDALERGTIVHRILENINILDSNASNLKNGIDGIDVDNGIKKYIDNYFKIIKEHRKVLKGKLLKSLNEYRFRVPLDENLNLNGVIDRIDIYENDGEIEAYIFDYKTNKINNDDEIEEVINHYKPQIHAYSYALNKLKSISGYTPSLKGAFLYLLDVGKYIEVDISGFYVSDTMKKIINDAPYLLGIKNFTDYSGTKNMYCSLCKYNKICK
ncbi:UvrD-helicase domain-containing protein [Thermoanaerobacterium thermosaccharolyticum]|uniref:UvrD-helicase domain-containing protein n=1 Tax=Thermoanaerobacterium thermosaccharolyticum TaxID=1517 RepID=UPI003D2E7481